jgi:transposase-like protein
MLLPPTLGAVTKLAQMSRQTKSVAISIEKTETPRRSLRRRLSPQTIEELVARYTAGEKTPALSRECGISGSGLRDLLRAEGVSLRGHAITPEDAERAVHLYGRGMTIKQVVAQIGYSDGTIRRVLRKHGVVTKSRGRKMRAVNVE